MVREMHIYDLDSPIDILSLIIGKDSETGNTFFQLSLKNISQKIVRKINFKALIFQSTLFTINPPAENIVRFVLNNIEIQPNSNFFSEKKFYLMNHNDVTNLEITFESIEFSNGEIWDRSEDGLKIYYLDRLTEPTEIVPLENKIGQNAICYPLDFQTYWLCSCGRFNKGNKTSCDRCNLKKTHIMKFGQNSNSELNASTSELNERDDKHFKYMNDKENHVDQKNFNHNKFKNILIGLMLVSILGLGYYVFQLSRDKNKLSDEFVSEMSSIDQTDLPSNTIVKSTESTYSNNLSSVKNTNYTIDQMNLIRTFGDYDESEGFFYYSLNSDELGSELIKNFNNAWIDYVNEGIQNIFNYTVPDSPAYEGSIDFDPENSSQKFLEINVGQATLIGQDLFIKVNEKLEITKPDGVTVKNYDWIYQAKFHTDKFKVFDYFNDDYPADDQVVNDTFDINTLPFYTSGTFAGGDVTDGLAINEIRYGSYDQYDRFVFDCFEFASSSNSKSNIVPFYNVKFNSDTSSAMFYFNGVREFDATLDKLLESSAVSDVFFLPVYDDQAYAFIIDFRPGTAIKVFEMEDHARIILDILK